MANSKTEAEKAIQVIGDKYFGKYEKAVKCLTKDQQQLLTFFDFLD